MIPSTAASNGPGSSDSINADRLGIVKDIANLYNNINIVPQIVDPNTISLEIPTVTSTLSVPLPSFALNYAGSVGNVGSCTLPLIPYCDNYLDVSPTGSDTVPGNFYPQAFSYQDTGTYTIQGTGATSRTAVDISGGAILWQNYTCHAIDVAGTGWGPQFTDQDGNGYLCRFTAHGGGIYSRINGNITLLRNLPDHTISQSGNVNVSLGIQYFDGNIELFVRANSTNVVLTTYVDTNPSLNPQSVWPGFLCDGAIVNFPPHLSTWNNSDNTPVLSWVNHNVPLDTRVPGVGLGVRFFLISVTTTFLSAISLYEKSLPATRLAAAGMTLDLITEAYC